MTLGRTNGFLLLVCQRFKQRRGPRDGAYDYEINLWIGPLGLHIYLPGVGASYIGWEPGWRRAGA